MISDEILEKFNGKEVKITAINIKCVEDIESIKELLLKKYGVEPEDRGDSFFISGRTYIKPWLPRERIGVFKVYGEQYYIESKYNSMNGRMIPRRSFYPLSALSLKNSTTLSADINKKLNHKIEYEIIE